LSIAVRAFQERRPCGSPTIGSAANDAAEPTRRRPVTVTENPTDSTTPTAPSTVPAASYELIGHDLYREIHKAIRVNLFDLTAAAGRTDPADRNARVLLATQVRDLVDFLVFHAEHEDTVLDGPTAEVAPDLARSIAQDHVALEHLMDRLRALANVVFDQERTDARAALHELYLDLASFTSRYLAHQEVEERVVMPALFAHFGMEGVLELHGRILSGIAPDQMTWSLAKMLPAMNVDERVELMAGMRAQAPAEAFAAMMGLAGDVLAADQFAALSARLDDALDQDEATTEAA
jgi:hypothetical protein